MPSHVLLTVAAAVDSAMAAVSAAVIVVLAMEAVSAVVAVVVVLVAAVALAAVMAAAVSAAVVATAADAKLFSTGNSKIVLAGSGIIQVIRVPPFSEISNSVS